MKYFLCLLKQFGDVLRGQCGERVGTLTPSLNGFSSRRQEISAFTQYLNRLHASIGVALESHRLIGKGKNSSLHSIRNPQRLAWVSAGLAQCLVSRRTDRVIVKMRDKDVGVNSLDGFLFVTHRCIIA